MVVERYREHPQPAAQGLVARMRPRGRTVNWTRIARVYDWQSPLERAALAAAVDIARVHDEDTVLDIGTGTGGLLRVLARQPRHPYQVIGADTSTAMLKQARGLPPPCRRVQTDGRRLPFADKRFSVVTAAYLLHVVDAATRRQIIAECHRVLRPGGRLVTVTPAWPRGRLARALYRPVAASAYRSRGLAGTLLPVDPRTDLEQAQFTVLASRYVARGYPSLCLVATRD